MRAQPGSDCVNLIRKNTFYPALSRPETILIHTVCRSQLVRVEGGRPFCEVCGRSTEVDEVEEADNSPSPFSG